MSVNEAGIHLNGIAELYGRFAVFSFVEKALSAFKILLLADVGIARTPDQQTEYQRKTDNYPENRGTPHLQNLPT